MLSRRRIGEHIPSSTQCVDVPVGVGVLHAFAQTMNKDFNRVRSDLLPVTMNRLFNGDLRHYPMDTVRLTVARLASYLEGWAYRNITATNLASMIAGMRHSEPPRLHEAEQLSPGELHKFSMRSGRNSASTAYSPLLAQLELGHAVSFVRSHC
jgi:hypothetical protein